MSTTIIRNNAALELDRAQQALTKALLLEPRNMHEIVELAENVRRAERQAIEAERRRR